MGLYDNIRCQFSLPLAGANDLPYQTKDTDMQGLATYEIREDGTLWLVCNNRGEMNPERVPFDGELNFYTTYGIVDGRMVDIPHSGWVEWCARYDHGELKQMKLVRDTPPEVRDGDSICP